MSNRAQSQRWFPNPYEDYKNGTEVKIHPAGIKMQMMNDIQQIFNNTENDMDGGLYVGAAGCSYLYLHVLNTLTEEEKSKILPLALNSLASQVAYNDEMKNKKLTKTDVVGFLLGRAGLMAVAAVFGKEVNDNDAQEKCINEYVNAAKICKPIDFFKPGGDEMLVGRAGYLCGALWLQQKLGYQPVPRNDLKEIWNVIIESGQIYSNSHKSPCPLMYSYYGTEYLGAAHGVSGIIQMLLAFPVFLQENPTAEELIKRTLDFYLTLQDEKGNFPCDMGDVNSRRRGENNLVHWCHGAPGALYMFAKAYLYYGDQKYLDACLKCGDIVWERGLLKKGPGICHGVAGNGYVFLILHRLLDCKDEKHLYRAYRFAEFLSTPQFVREARRPDCPYSLYEGTAGTACFLADVLNPSLAEFPFFNLYNNYTST